VLQYFLIDNPNTVYNLLRRENNKTLITKTAQLNDHCACYTGTATNLLLLPVYLLCSTAFF